MYPYPNGMMAGGKTGMGPHKLCLATPERDRGWHSDAHFLLGLFLPCVHNGAKPASEGPEPHPQVS